MKLWLIFTHPGGHQVVMHLSSAPLWWGMTGEKKKGNRREMRETEGDEVEWRAATRPVVILQGVRGCQWPCNPPPPLPSFPLYHPLHLTMTNRICSLSKSHRLPLLLFLLSYPAVLIPFVIYTALVSLQGQAVAARLGRRAHRPGKEEPPVPPVAAFRKPFNGFRRIC